MLERIFLIFLNLISIFLFYITFSFEIFEMDNYSLGPAFFPRLICIILFLLTLSLLFYSIVRKHKVQNEGNIKSKYSIITIIIFLIYVLALDKLGYLFSTIVFMIALLFLLRSRGVLINIVFSLLFSGAIYFLFSKGFNVSLPEGFFI